MRRHLANSVAVTLIVGLLSIAVEYAYRLYLVDTYAHARFGVTLVDRLFEIEDIRRRRAGDGLYLPGLNVRHRLFDVDHRLLVDSTIETNAQGYRSAFDYPAPSEGEFRIAVLGDSLTAQHLSDSSWTDVVHARLNADTSLADTLGVNRFVVYNFGVVGAGFDTFAQVYADHARRYRPHLVLVNFITPDVLRHDLRVEPVDDLGLGRRQYRGAVDISVGSVTAEAPVSCDAPEPSLGRAGCVPSAIIRIDDRFTFDKGAVGRVKLHLSRGFTGSFLWWSTYPYALAAAMGEPFSAVRRTFADIIPIFRDRVAGVSPAADSWDDSVTRSVAALAKLQEFTANPVLLHNPTSGELLAGVDRTPLAKGIESASSLRIIYMAEALPERRNAESVRGWFNLPHDSHFSDEGIQIYGEAVYRVVRELLLSGDRPGG
jgi:hypothetical protein